MADNEQPRDSFVSEDLDAKDESKTALELRKMELQKELESMFVQNQDELPERGLSKTKSTIGQAQSDYAKKKTRMQQEMKECDRK